MFTDDIIREYAVCALSLHHPISRGRLPRADSARKRFPMTVSLTTFRDHLPAIAASLPVTACVSHDVCQIDLLADRIPSLDRGSTHTIYRDWRFAVMCGAETERTEHLLFAAPVASVPGTPGHAGNSMALRPGQGEIAVGSAARFTWATTTAGATNPFAVAHDQARQWLVAAGWRPDGTTSGQYRESVPTESTGLASWEDEGGGTTPGGCRGS